MTHLDLRLLGVPSIQLDGTPVALTRRCSVALLAYLTVSSGQHPRELLTALFGGDGSEDQARRRLSNALADLRQQLAACLLTSWHVVGLRPDLSYTSDVQQFDDLLARARDHDDVDALRAAAELYRGEFLAGLSLANAPDFEMWLLLHRESYHAQFVQALEALVTSAMRRSAWADGAWAARRLVELEPWHEEAHRQLMLCMARSGQRHSALAQFEICRRQLRDELDSEPSEQTMAVFEELKMGGVVPNNLPAQTTECIGRENETELLEKRLAIRESRLISVVGPPGSGKTRLAVEAAATLTRGGRPASSHAFRDGVFIVHANGTAPERLPTEIAGALGMDADEPWTASRLGERLSPQWLLLILDGLTNSPDTARVVAELLACCPGLTLLITAVTPLRVEGEHVLSLGGLDLPARPEDLDRAPAGVLLLAEVRRADMRFKLQPAMRASLVQVCHLVRGLPRGLILAARALPETPSVSLVGAIEAALTVPAIGKRPSEPWWNSPQWASVLDTLETLERPRATPSAWPPAIREAQAGDARRATPLAVVCTPDMLAEGLIERLQGEGLVVCVTHDLQSCLRVATTVGPDVVLLDGRMPRRLEHLLRAHPVSSGASIRWLSEPPANPATPAAVFVG